MPSKAGLLRVLSARLLPEDFCCLIFIVFYGDKLGRRRAVILETLVMLIGTAIQASSFEQRQLLVGRISEIAPPKFRGFLVIFEGALTTCGIMISYRLNYGFYYINMDKYGSFQWRCLTAFQAVFGFIFIAGLFALPESPRWLLKHHEDDTALEILSRLNRFDAGNPKIQEEVTEIRRVVAITGSSKLTMKEFSHGYHMNRWSASLAFTSQAFQQIDGINIATYYATTVSEDSLDFSIGLARLLTACHSTEYFVVAITVTDTYKAPAYATTVFIFVFHSFFAVGWLSVTWLYPAEVTPIRIRAEANRLTTSANWILAPIMLFSISWKSCFLFMCFNFAFIPVVYFTFVETSGISLEKLDAIFAKTCEKKENPKRDEAGREGVLHEERRSDSDSRVTLQGDEEWREKLDSRKGDDEWCRDLGFLVKQTKKFKKTLAMAHRRRARMALQQGVRAWDIVMLFGDVE
ncbi:related to sugar transporter [Phialocephala subalpina]|uniref:Related to sugar transporter n=1 Tax=Phialocephala subalpina TaxID=576137 RepID=A0A1L7XVA7_9HELO|nr:related to sugar transporter [Phialocephala subalpina]